MKIGDEVRIFGSEKTGIITEILLNSDTNQNLELKVHYDGFDIIIKSEGIEYLNGVLSPLLIKDDSTQYHNIIKDLPESFYKPWAAIGNKPDLSKLKSDNHKDTK